METIKLEATSKNVAKAIESIEKFAADKEYQIIGDLKEKKQGFLSGIFNLNLNFESKSKEKVLRNYLTRLETKRMGMALANKFLHFLYKKVYKVETAAPKVDFSEKELKIKAARKAWRIALEASKKAEEAYKLEKGNFYKTK